MLSLITRQYFLPSEMYSTSTSINEQIHLKRSRFRDRTIREYSIS